MMNHHAGGHVDSDEARLGGAKGASNPLKLVRQASAKGLEAAHTLSESLEKTVDWNHMAPKRKRFFFGFLIVFAYLWLGGWVLERSEANERSFARCTLKQTNELEKQTHDQP